MRDSTKDTTLHVKLPWTLNRKLQQRADDERRTKHNMVIVLLAEALKDDYPRRAATSGKGE